MNSEQFDELNNLPHNPLMRAVDSSTKTLILGYTLERYTMHVYQQAGELHAVVYEYPDAIIISNSGKELNADLLVPNKRVYPEQCDFEFCKALLEKGVDIPFTSFNHENESILQNKTLFGRTIEELESVVLYAP